MKIIAWSLLIAVTTILLAISICQPYYLSDTGNSFFREFVTHEMLAVLGVIVTITLASAASIHLELNKLEERTGAGFPDARRAVKLSSYALVLTFGAAFFIVMAKPWVGDGLHATAAMNSLSILTFMFSLAIMADLTMAIFRIPAIRK
jgi:hypothetical protein